MVLLLKAMQSIVHFYGNIAPEYGREDFFMKIPKDFTIPLITLRLQQFEFKVGVRNVSSTVYMPPNSFYIFFLRLSFLEKRVGYSLLFTGVHFPNKKAIKINLGLPRREYRSGLSVSSTARLELNVTLLTVSKLSTERSSSRWVMTRITLHLYFWNQPLLKMGYRDRNEEDIKVSQ